MACLAATIPVRRAAPMAPPVTMVNLVPSMPSQVPQPITTTSSSHRGALGHYILGKTIGEGTFGKVKLGRHILTGERVAVKVLEKDRIQEVADIERVAREVQLLKLIRHPHVVQLLEIIETKNQLYLIMEYASGGELFDYIVQHQRVSEPQACVFFHQIIAGVEKIHAMNVVHRDLKPENLLLDEHKCIKIVDFGLSNRFETGQLLKTACGSPCYAPPEMVSGQNYVPQMCDLWSCGVILFAMVCGFLPFEDSNTSALYKKILAANYQPPSFISDSVKDLISGLLTVDPAKRFTIADVRAHPWYKQVPDSSLKPKVVGELPGGLDEDVLEELKRHGFPREYAINCLQNNKHNSVTTTYYLLAAKRKRMMEHLQMQQEKRNAAERATSPTSPTSPGRPGASREGGPSGTSTASTTAPAETKITTRMVASPDPTHRVTTVTSPQITSPQITSPQITTPQITSPQPHVMHVSTPKSSPVVVTPNASMSRPCAPPSPSSISGRALSQDKHPAQVTSPNSSRAVTPNASISRPMAGTQATPVASRTASHETPQDAHLSPATHPRTTREAIQKGTPPAAVPSSMCLDGQARYIIRPVSSKVSRLSSVPISRHMITGAVTAPPTPRQTLSARAPSRESPAQFETARDSKRFTMVDPRVPPSPQTTSRIEETGAPGVGDYTILNQKGSATTAAYQLLAKRKKTTKDNDPVPSHPKPGASTLDRSINSTPKPKESNPKVTPRQVHSVASPAYGVRQVITPRVSDTRQVRPQAAPIRTVASPVQMSRMLGSPTPVGTPNISPMSRAMVSTVPAAGMAYPSAWAYGRRY